MKTSYVKRGLIAVCAIAIGGMIAEAADVHAYGAETTYDQLKPILDRHCSMCHSEKPVMPFYGRAPAGVRLDSVVELEKVAARVLAVSTQTNQMPPGNLTAMTEEERKALAAAIEAQWPRAR